MGMDNTKPLVPLASLSKTNPFIIVALIDSSSSMRKRQQETIEGFNGLLIDQRQVKTPTVLHLTTFDTTATHLYDAEPIEDVQPLNYATYDPAGGTALYDAVGGALSAIRARYPGRRRGLFVVITDGEDYDSRHYSAAGVEQLRSDAARDGWDFVYLGASPGAWRRSGITPDSAGFMDFGSVGGVAKAYAHVSRNLVVLRSRDVTSKGVSWDPNAPPPEEGFQSPSGRRFKRA